MLHVLITLSFTESFCSKLVIAFVSSRIDPPVRECAVREGEGWVCLWVPKPHAVQFKGRLDWKQFWGYLRDEPPSVNPSLLKRSANTSPSGPVFPLNINNIPSKINIFSTALLHTVWNWREFLHFLSLFKSHWNGWNYNKSQTWNIFQNENSDFSIVQRNWRISLW